MIQQSTRTFFASSSASARSFVTSFPTFFILILSHNYNLIMQMLIIVKNYWFSWSSLSLKMGVVVFLSVWPG